MNHLLLHLRGQRFKISRFRIADNLNAFGVDELDKPRHRQSHLLDCEWAIFFLIPFRQPPGLVPNGILDSAPILVRGDRPKVPPGNVKCQRSKFNQDCSGIMECRNDEITVEIQNTFFSTQYSDVPFFHLLVAFSFEFWPERAPQAPPCGPGASHLNLVHQYFSSSADNTWKSSF